MNDQFHPVPTDKLLKMILDELENSNSIMGIPAELFFNPKAHPNLSVEIYNQTISSPIGVAAGPHTQLARNIVAAWLCGARYIELKTIQTLDELEVPKPCIDMQDEGYNCEWSQELKLEQSFNEYLNAWIIIHILNHKLQPGNPLQTVFNMSVGYNLEGIQKTNVQRFLEKMQNCSDELNEKIDSIRTLYPAIDELAIPSTISNSITLSTMHGCPPDEIEAIARYLIADCGLHTLIKLNPTLLGADELRTILNNELNFPTQVSDAAFEHDLKYPDAIQIIDKLSKLAARKGVTFGIKLTNTLESVNRKNIFPADVKMMYMSGRALHPLAINLANTLQKQFGHTLHISFSGGVDAFNIAETLRCGFKTVTVCSDLLKPGGYMRLHQYIERLHSFSVADSSGSFLETYARKVRSDNRYRNTHIHPPTIKGQRELDYFDCIAAPCTEACATHQDIPEYLYRTATGKPDEALGVILRTNPFPATTGMICDHLCQGRCTRINYDNPLLIRKVKRYIAENSETALKPKPSNGKSAAIIGAGPSGLSCAFYLALEGFKVDVFEANGKAGGMVQYAIPGFRLNNKAFDADLKRIEALGVAIRYNHRITRDSFSALRKQYDAVYLAPGAQLAAKINIEGTDAKGVIDPLTFLKRVKKGDISDIGNKVVIIGGGNTAMDAARTALRIVGKQGKVIVAYRRTISEMPADEGEIRAAIAEGAEIAELISPKRIISDNGTVCGVLFGRMKLQGSDAKGRPRPVELPDSEHTITCNTVIPAVGQDVDIDFAPSELLKADTQNLRTLLGNVYIGGDALRKASTAINAIADGRNAARQITLRTGNSESESHHTQHHRYSKRQHIIKRAVRTYSPIKEEELIPNPTGFSPISRTLTHDEAIAESSRCMACDELCNACVTVCPNLANFSYNIFPVSYRLQKASVSETGEISLSADRLFEVKQPYQIINIADFCNECGNCATFCPTSGAPYLDKPKLHLTTRSFNESDSGYMLSVLNNRTILIFKQKGGIKTLTEKEGEYIYETDHVYARFEQKTFRPIEVKALTPCVKQIQFQHAAEMSIIMMGAKQLLNISI